MKAKLVKVWQQKAVSAKSTPISRCCKLIDLQSSSDYAITVRQALLSKVNNTQIALKAAFMASGQTYGGRRLVGVLHNKVK